MLLPPPICIECEKTFIRTRTWQHFCGCKCRLSYHRREQRMARELLREAKRGPDFIPAPDVDAERG